MEKGTRDSAPLLQGGATNGAGTQPAAPPAKPQQGTPMCACLTITYYRPVRGPCLWVDGWPQLCAARVAPWARARVRVSAGLGLQLTRAVRAPHQFFDVDTDDVVARLRKALVPSAGDQSLLAEVQGKPDLYGPFWVCTTLIFVIGAAANFASWVYWDKVGADAHRCPRCFCTIVG